MLDIFLPKYCRGCKVSVDGKMDVTESTDMEECFKMSLTWQSGWVEYDIATQQNGLKSGSNIKQLTTFTNVESKFLIHSAHSAFTLIMSRYTNRALYFLINLCNISPPY